MAIDWEAVLAGPPVGPSGAGATLRPIGIPETFRPYVQQRELSGPIGADQAERRGLVGGTVREPYYEGAEYGPDTTMSPERRAELQAQMAQAGLIKKSQTYRVGFWDETSSSAYKQLLSYANQSGVDADSALADLLSRPEMDAAGNLVTDGLAADPGKVTATTSALTLEQQVQAVAERDLGRKLKQSEVAKFARLYQGIESSFNASASQMQDEAADGYDRSIEEAPPVGAAAEQFIDSNYAQEAAGQDAYGYLEALRGLIES